MEYRGDISPLFDSGWSVKTQNWKIEFNRGKSLRMSSLSAFFLQRRADYKVLLVHHQLYFNIYVCGSLICFLFSGMFLLHQAIFGIYLSSGGKRGECI